MNPNHILLSTEDRRVIHDSRMSIERPNIQDWNLLIRHVAVSDNGQYICTINTVPIQIKRVWLTVLEVGTTGEVLVIHNISRYCGGLYECEAKNSVGSINVVVEFPPEVKFRTPNRMHQTIGKETLLECFITAFPQGVNQWQKDGTPIIIENGGKYRTEIYKEDHFTVALYLRILNLEAADFGIYTCEASNKLGTDYDRIYLYEYFIPTLPKPTPSQALESWRYRHLHYEVITQRTARVTRLQMQSKGTTSIRFVGSGQVYNGSSPAVLPHIYQNMIAVIVLALSVYKSN